MFMLVSVGIFFYVSKSNKKMQEKMEHTKKVENSYHLQKEMTKSFYDAESYEH